MDTSFRAATSAAFDAEHFRLTDAQWKYLSDAFKIEGVPTYLIVDRKGNTTFRQTGFPGVERMKEELLKVAK